jgi:hypothetical protein
MKKAVIFAPFWRQPGHVGNNRVERFVRWLSDDGYQVVMIRASSQDERCETAWGTEITVRDPLGLFRDTTVEDKTTVVARKPNKLRRWLAYWLFNPDPSVMWARAAVANQNVQKALTDADFILSSSPPESAHVGAWMLSKKFNIRHIVDMRDGWLDEPLKPILVNSALRRWQEARLEAKILANAAAVLVTSDVWRDLLCQRLPTVADKTLVLTNGYPKKVGCGEATNNPVQTEDGLVLIHAGRFTGSDTRRTASTLLTPLLDAIRQRQTLGIVRLIGSLSTEELAEIAQYQSRFEDAGWRIECPGAMPRNQLLEALPKASGLLLLSASHAAIPSKLFEYIISRRPILVVTERESATWNVCKKLPQTFLISTNGEHFDTTLSNFLDNCAIPAPQGLCPAEFTETSLAALFRSTIARLCSIAQPERGI